MASASRPAPETLTSAGSDPLSDLQAQARPTDAPAFEDLALALNKAPWDFDFFRAGRRIECACPTLPRIGTSQRPHFDAVRFGQQATLAFPPATLAAFTPATPERPPHVYVNFMGLLGPHGPLPLHITEYVRQRVLSEHDPAMARFLDMLHHRLISLFYRAWAVNQQTVSFDRPGDDHFGNYVGTLFGLGQESLCNRDAVPDVAKRHYAGRLTHHPHNAEGLRAIVEDYLGIKTEIIEFVGQWIDLPADSLCRLGESPSTGLLGSTAIVGSRIWEIQYKFRVRMGPMNYQQYERLLPGGNSLQRLVAWVKNYTGAELAFDVQLVLKKEEVPSCKMGGGVRLGWSTWTKSQPTPKDAEDLILQPPGAA